jgi:hypothetical protein
MSRHNNLDGRDALRGLDDWITRENPADAELGPGPAVQCDGCGKMFDADDDNCWTSMSVHGETTQCWKCRGHDEPPY